MLGLPRTAVSAFSAFCYLVLCVAFVLFGKCVWLFLCKLEIKRFPQKYPKLDSELCLQYLSFQRNTIGTCTELLQHIFEKLQREDVKLNISQSDQTGK